MIKKVEESEQDTDWAAVVHEGRQIKKEIMWNVEYVNSSYKGNESNFVWKLMLTLVRRIQFVYDISVCCSSNGSNNFWLNNIFVCMAEDRVYCRDDIRLTRIHTHTHKTQFAKTSSNAGNKSGIISCSSRHNRTVFRIVCGTHEMFFFLLLI